VQLATLQALLDVLLQPSAAVAPIRGTIRRSSVILDSADFLSFRKFPIFFLLHLPVLLVVRQVLLLEELPDLYKDKTLRISF
jgi:hypothetical protein